MKTTRTATLLLLVFSLCFFLPSIGIAQEVSENSALDQMFETLRNLSPSGSIDIKMGTEKSMYLFGEPVDIRFLADQSCYAVMMHIFHTHDAEDPSQYTLNDIQFFIPNGFVPDNKIEAGRIYSTQLDFDLPIAVEKPAGVSTINLFCSPEPINLFDPDFTPDDIIYTISPTDQSKLQQLAERLAQLVNHQWNGGSVKFNIAKERSIGQTRNAAPPPPGALLPIVTAGTTGKTDDSLQDTSLFP